MPKTMTQFVVLMWNDRYVDVSRLHQGILLSIMPILYPPETTKESIINSHKRNFAFTGTGTEKNMRVLLDNLMLCEIVEVVLERRSHE